MTISEKKMQIVIDNYFKSECDVNTSIRQAFEKGFKIGIKKVPSADAVEVVRCGECKHMLSSGGCSIFADSDIRPSASDFCSYGERE